MFKRRIGLASRVEFSFDLRNDFERSQGSCASELAQVHAEVKVRSSQSVGMNAIGRALQLRQQLLANGNAFLGQGGALSVVGRIVCCPEASASELPGCL